MNCIKDIKYGEHPENLLDVYLPEGEIDGVFLYFHGGGLEHGDKTHVKIPSPYLYAHNIVLISADYRMYPDAKYPDFIYDAAAATAWAVKYVKETLKTDKKLFVGGSSAGGYLSMMLCFDQKYLKAYGIGNDDIAGYLHDAGQPTAHFNVLRERGMDHRRCIVDETAPLYYVGLEEKYPPMRFIVSDDDMKCRYEQTMLILQTMSHFGYTGVDHRVMHSKHCKYLGFVDENGDSVFGKLVEEFIKDTENR